MAMTQIEALFRAHGQRLHRNATATAQPILTQTGNGQTTAAMIVIVMTATVMIVTTMTASAGTVMMTGIATMTLTVMAALIGMA